MPCSPEVFFFHYFVHVCNHVCILCIIWLIVNNRVIYNVNTNILWFIFLLFFMCKQVAAFLLMIVLLHSNENAYLFWDVFATACPEFTQHFDTDVILSAAVECYLRPAVNFLALGFLPCNIFIISVISFSTVSTGNILDCTWTIRYYSSMHLPFLLVHFADNVNT